MASGPGSRHKVFGIGMSRTGTTSLTSALCTLGYRTEHFPCDEVTRDEIMEFLRAPTERLTLRITDTVDALTDTPITITFKALDRAYPGSKFILTVRDRASWLESCHAYWTAFLGEGMANVRPELKAYVEMINDTLYGVQDFDAARFADAYARHVSDVRGYFRDRPQDLVVIDLCAGEGWDRLCAFLDEPRPDLEFPHENLKPTQP